MMNALVSPSAMQVHPMHIQLQGLLTHVFRTASGFRHWNVLAPTVHSQIPFGIRLGSSEPVLPRSLMTFRTCLRSSILPKKSIHSPNAVIAKLVGTSNGLSSEE
jgi:hypothetical protein